MYKVHDCGKEYQVGKRARGRKFGGIKSRFRINQGGEEYHVVRNFMHPCIKVCGLSGLIWFGTSRACLLEQVVGTHIGLVRSVPPTLISINYVYNRERTQGVQCDAIRWEQFLGRCRLGKL